LRSVIHDGKGAGMLIEGDPKAFVLWARRQRALEEATGKGALSAVALMASWGADYWVARTPEASLRPAYVASGWFVYDLRPFRKQGW